MKYEFEVYQMEVEGHLFWVAKSKALKGCVGQGETADEAIKELETNESEWLLTAKEYGITIPPMSVRHEAAFSGKVSLRFSPFVHEEASKHAKEQGISLNQYLNDAVVYYNGLLKSSYANMALLKENTDVIETNSTTIINFDDYRNKANTVNIQFDEDWEEM